MADYKNHTPPSEWPRIEREIKEWKPAPQKSAETIETKRHAIAPFVALIVAIIIITIKNCQ